MGLLGWVMMGLAIWHFTIFLPDRFWGGIVGAFVGSLVGAIVVGLIIYGVKVSALRDPGRKGDRHRGRAVRGARARCSASRSSTSRASAANARSPAPRTPSRRLAAARFRLSAGRSLVGGAEPPLRDPRRARSRGVARLRARAGRERRARAGAGAPRARRAGAARARSWPPSEEHPPSAFAGIERGGRADPRATSRAGARITVHGDYDVDGVCSTAVLVRALRALGADVDWYLPDRAERRLRAERGHRASGWPRAARGCW